MPHVTRKSDADKLMISTTHASLSKRGLYVFFTQNPYTVFVRIPGMSVKRLKNQTELFFPYVYDIALFEKLMEQAVFIDNDRYRYEPNPFMPVTKSAGYVFASGLKPYLSHSGVVKAYRHKSAGSLLARVEMD